MIHPLAKNASRFVIFFTLFLLATHTLSILAVSYAVLYTAGSLWPGYGMMAATPILSAVFAALFFRGRALPSLRHGVEMALAWGGFFAAVSALLNPFLYGIPWQTEFATLSSVAVDLGVVIAFAVMPTILSARRGGTVPLLEHSEEAWQPSSGQHPQEPA